MSIKSFFRDSRKLAIFTTVIIFLALIRTISEPFRLQYYSEKPLTYEEIKPFLIGALVSAIALLVMTILFYYRRYKFIIATCILAIVLLVIVKIIYLL